MIDPATYYIVALEKFVNEHNIPAGGGVFYESVTYPFYGTKCKVGHYEATVSAPESTSKNLAAKKMLNSLIDKMNPIDDVDMVTFDTFRSEEEYVKNFLKQLRRATIRKRYIDAREVDIDFDLFKYRDSQQ